MKAVTSKITEANIQVTVYESESKYGNYRIIGVDLDSGITLSQITFYKTIESAMIAFNKIF